MTKFNLSILFFLIIAFNISNSFAKVNDELKKYDIRNIPTVLLKDADVVIRDDEMKFEIEDENSSSFEVKYAVTIFKKTDNKYNNRVLYYDKFREIDDIDGTIYDANGEEVRTMDKEDIKDYSANHGYSLYEDNRVKVVELYYDKFPYTVEFTYKLTFNYSLNWPEWYSRISTEPVQYSNFEVIVPNNQSLRYWSNSDSLKPRILNIDDKKSYFWEAKNLLPLSKETDIDDIEDFAAIVKIAPNKFKVEDYEGNMNSWKDFGLWYYELYKDRLNLPETSNKDFQSTIKEEDNAREKVIKLYKKMQSKTRYVSVQLGIGGWQPFDAAYVSDHGYGDCKALSNYMVAILKSANINAYPVLIHNGHERTPLIKEFPSHQFNHVIVCVPLEKDTMWLECTSQTRPAGSIGSGNENRNALMITPEGGVIVKTPTSSAEQNVQRKIIIVSLFNGYANAKAEIKWTGDQQDYVRSVAVEETPKEKEEWIKNLFEVPDIKINKSTFNENENEISLSGEFNLYKYASVTGKRIFFNPNLMERRSYVPKDISQKLSPQRFYYPYVDIDSTAYKIPQDYMIESLPTEMNIHSSFGSFTEKSIPGDEGEIVFVRKLQVDNYEVPAENYNEYKKFFSDVVKADRGQVVLIKKEK